MRKRILLPVIRDKDLKIILESRDLISDFDAGRIQCQFCGETLTWANIGGLLVYGGKLVFCCNLPNCIEQATSGRCNK